MILKYLCFNSLVIIIILKKIYMIFGLTDESFSINCATEVPDSVDKGLFMFYVTFLNQIYWVAGSTIGAVFGNFIFFSTEGIDFVMTAMFTVILVVLCIRGDKKAQKTKIQRKEQLRIG